MTNTELTTHEAAQLLGISVRRVQQFIKSGRLKATKFGRDWRLSLKEVQAFGAQERLAGYPKGKKRKTDHGPTP